MTYTRMTMLAIPTLILALVASSGAKGDFNLVTNGDFESTTNGAGQMGYNTNATGWTTNGYNFIFASGTADTTGVTSQYGNLQLWGPNNGSANGLPASSPSGGNFVAADGAYDAGPISQTINGLTVGNSYKVGFEWAGAQQYGFTGANTEQWQVSLGNQTQSTAVYDNPSHGFSGWMQESFTFTATSTSETLSFLAIGTPISPSVPPMSLLDGVTLTAVPEPSGLSLMAVSLLCMAGLVIRMRSKAKLAAV